MHFTRWRKAAPLLFLVMFFPQRAHSLGQGHTKPTNGDSEIAATLLFFGVCLIVSGVMIMKNKKYGPEEGLRGSSIKGENAEVWGFAQLVLGFILVMLGLST